MKIDFNKEGMNLKLDKVPRLIYINEDGIGCGQVYEHGVRIKELQEVGIHAKSLEGKFEFDNFKYLIRSYNEDTHGSKITGLGDPFKLFTVEVSLKDADLFNELLDTLRLVVSNERVPMDVREDFADKINVILEREE